MGQQNLLKNKILGIEQKPTPIINLSDDLNGPEVVCGANVVYSLVECGVAVSSWTVSSTLEIINQTSSHITVKADNPGFSNGAYVEANFSDGTSIRKDIFIGKPAFNVELLPNIYPTTARAEITGKYAEINDQWITDATVEEISGYGDVNISFFRYNDKFIVSADGPSNIHWYKNVKFTGTNSCGSYFVIFTLEPPPLEPPPDEPCNNLYIFESTDVNVYRIIIPPDPCGNNSTTTSTTTTMEASIAMLNAKASLKNKNITIFVYNFSGALLFETDEKIVDLNVYKDGIYILKAEIGGKTYTKKVLKN